MRRPRRPILYPAVMLGAFVLAFVESSGVSPWAGIRPLTIAVLVGLIGTVIVSAATGSRDRGALIALVGGLIAAVGAQARVGAALACVLLLLAIEAVVARRRPIKIRWPLITRFMSTATAILLLAIAIRGVQDGRAGAMTAEFLAEAPGQFQSAVAPDGAASETPRLPDVYLVLLDGYPRADKLASSFGIDNSVFVEALRDRGFTVSDHSRSNYPATRMTLASMLNGAHLGDLFSDTPGTPDWRRAIDEGSQLNVFRAAGYRVVSISSGYEDAVLRRADRFIDTGQVNEFERALLVLTALRALAPDQLAGFLVHNQGDRIRQSFDAALQVAEEGGPPRLAFVHIGSPHAPLALDSSGSAVNVARPGYPFDDRQEAHWLGAEFSSLLRGQIEYLNRRTLELMDVVGASTRDAIVVVFSDHGSGVAFSEQDALGTDLDLRTANFLAVSAPGLTAMIDDRSTLINLLPRIASAVLGTPPVDAPEDIRVYPAGFGRYRSFERPD